MQEQINYSDIIELGFEEKIIDTDKAYFKTHGYSCSIITLKLTGKIYLDWEKDTKLCELIRMNNKKDCDIKARMPVMNYGHLREIISFYTDDNSNGPLFS